MYLTCYKFQNCWPPCELIISYVVLRSSHRKSHVYHLEGQNYCFSSTDEFYYEPQNELLLSCRHLFSEVVYDLELYRISIHKETLGVLKLRVYFVGALASTFISVLQKHQWPVFFPAT